MISQVDAIEYCATHFPKGPEKLAEYLGASIQYSDIGPDGWCIDGPQIVIHINSKSPSSKQRFTLAHELAHLVLGTEPDIATIVATAVFNSESEEEKQANALAAKLLIPHAVLTSLFTTSKVIDAKAVDRLAKKAGVSPIVAALRVLNAIEELNIPNAAVVYFTNKQEQWRYPRGIRFTTEDASRILDIALNAPKAPVRETLDDSQAVIGSVINTPFYDILFIQILDHAEANQVTSEERYALLRSYMFSNDPKFEQSLAGTLGNTKNKCTGQSLQAAMDYFDEKYLVKCYRDLRLAKLMSPEGREFLVARFRQMGFT